MNIILNMRRVSINQSIYVFFLNTELLVRTYLIIEDGVEFEIPVTAARGPAQASFYVL